MENRKIYKHNVYKAVVEISYTINGGFRIYEHNISGELKHTSYIDCPDHIVKITANKIVNEYIGNIHKFGFVDVLKEDSEKSNFIPFHKIENISVRYYDHIIESDFNC